MATPAAMYQEDLLALITAERQHLAAREISRAVARRMGDHDSADAAEWQLAQDAEAALHRLAHAITTGSYFADATGRHTPEQIRDRTLAVHQVTSQAAREQGLTLQLDQDGTFELLDEDDNPHYD